MSVTQTDLSGFAKGDVIAEREYHLTREDLVRYAGASNDFNPIHYRDDIAAQVGLPGVLAHGMLTMGLAVQPVMDLLGDPARLIEYGVRFTKPVVVDPVEGAHLAVTAKIGETAGEDGVGRIDLTVQVGGQNVLGKVQIRAQFAPSVAVGTGGTA